MKTLLLTVLGVMLVSPCAVQAQRSRKPLSVEDIEYLLREGVTPRRVASLVEEQGVKFEVTEAVRERLRKAGADGGVIAAVEQASLAYAREKLEEERRKVEEEKKKLEEASHKAEEQRKQEGATKRKAEEESKRKEEAAKRKTEEETRRKAEQEARQQEAERRRTEEDARRKAEEAQQRQTGEMVTVLAGEFYMGCNGQVDTECDDDEKPGRLMMMVDAFKIDKIGRAHV